MRRGGLLCVGAAGESRAVTFVLPSQVARSQEHFVNGCVESGCMPRASSVLLFRSEYSSNPRLSVRMGWQTTLTLSKRSKGCHLVTDEVLQSIRPGLEGVQVRICPLCECWTLIRSLGRDVIPVHVGPRLDNRVHLFSQSHRQHTSAALTINENCDPGEFIFGGWYYDN